MKNLNEMTDRKLMDYESEMKMILKHRNNTFTPHLGVTDQQREEALSELHRIEMEKYNRGWCVPAEEDRVKFERWIEKYEARLAMAEQAGDTVKIFAMRHGIQMNRDALNWLNGIRE